MKIEIQDPFSPPKEPAIPHGDLISIIIPAFNPAVALRSTIESVLSQSYLRVELLVVDGGRGEGSSGVLQEYKEDPRFCRISEPDRGRSHAINRGLALCRGAFFNWLNPGDHLHPNALQEIADRFLKQPEMDIVSGYTDEGRDLSREVFHRTRLQIHDTLEESLTVGGYCQPSTFWRTERLRQLGGLSEDLHFCMGTDLWTRYLLSYGQRGVAMIDKVLAFRSEQESLKTDRNFASFHRETQLIFDTLHSRLEAPSHFISPAFSSSPLRSIAPAIGSHFHRERYLGKYCERRVRMEDGVNKREARRWLWRSFSYPPRITPWKIKMASRVALQWTLGLGLLPYRLGRSLLKRIRPTLFRSTIRLVRGGDRLLGPRFVSVLLTPFVAGDFLRRLPDYRLFRRLHATLPVSFWQRGPLAHYLRMIRIWQETLAVALVYDRLSAPAWASRLTVSGTPPHRLPEWGKRPVVVVFMHTGGFGLLRYWLRAQGTPTASLIRGLPEIVTTYAQGIREAGDNLYGLSNLPHTFGDIHSLRHAIRFLRPGRALTMALEGGPLTKNRVGYEINGNFLHLEDGAVRIAQRTDAILLPVSVHRRGPCRFEFRFGSPVPDHLVRDGESHAAMKHLVRELWLPLENDPTAIFWSTLEALAPDKMGPRTAWP